MRYIRLKQALATNKGKGYDARRNWLTCKKELIKMQKVWIGI